MIFDTFTVIVTVVTLLFVAATLCALRCGNKH
jgi:hypothetical protein